MYVHTQCTHFTCRYKQNASPQHDVPFALVETAGCDTDSSHQQQDGTKNGKDVGGPDHSCRERENSGEERQMGEGERRRALEA